MTTVLIGPVAIALALLWAWSVRVRGRREISGGLGFVLAIIGAAVATVSMWCGFQFIAQFVTLGTTWNLWIPAALGGAALEIIAWLYRLEKGLVSLNRGRLILTLRLAALVTLVLVLIEPILSTFVDREINREVAILIDDSASMQLSDQRLSISEMLDRADVSGIAVAAERPPLSHWRAQLEDARNQLTAAGAAHRASLPNPPAAQREQLTKTLSETRQTFDSIATGLQSVAESNANAKVAEDARNRLRSLRQKLLENVRRQTDEAEKQLAATDGNAEAVGKAIGAAVDQLDQLAAEWQASATAYDTAWYQQLSEADRKSITEAAAQSRFDIAVQTLRQSIQAEDSETEQAEEPSEENINAAETNTFIGQLGERYDLRFQRFARSSTEAVDLDSLLESEGEGEGETEAVDEQDDTGVSPAPADEPVDVAEVEPADAPTSETALTDLSSALNHVLDNSSPETLAGVLLLSDGRHNGPVPVEDSLRRMGVQKTPLGAVAIGGRLGPVDSSILSLTAPESIYLGDRVSVRAVVKLDGLRGKEVKAVLRDGDQIVDEQIIKVADVNQRTELRFVHLPEAKGTFDYSVELEPLEAELFDTNNRWDFKLAVTDDRTNVLLVDSYPRWEFRYLRNLFYGRDKSVHLQYVLLNPDQIEGTDAPNTITASATRDFGDAEAHRLPTSEEEWRLFDVIIFGDIAPASVPDETWRMISDSVTERGALFVTIAGPRYMPHAFANQDFQNLMPVTWDISQRGIFESPEPSYRIELSNDGRNHSITRQATSRSENSRIWGGLPPLRWRFVPKSVKDSAEVLAFASPTDVDNANRGSAIDGSLDSVEAAIERLANRKTYEREHALITTQRNGLGKVAMLGFDQTWRMRYGIGDTLHHRLWGQIVRWGTGENLRSGNNFIRLGTDRLSYTPSDEINITVKLLDAERKPITDADIFAIVRRDGDQVVRQRLSYRSNSNGLYETSLADLPGPGEYHVEIEGDAIADAIGNDDELDDLKTEFMVVNTRNPIELAELTADRDFLSRAAQLTGGRVVEVNEAPSLIELFGAPRETLTERRDVTLWDTWPLLLTFLGLLTTEWIVRRRSGLA